jgi:hypothetical protein
MLIVKCEGVAHVESIRMQPFISEHDAGKLSSFICTSVTHLSEQGVVLKRRAEALLRHNMQVRKLAAADSKLRDSLLDNDPSKFSKLYSKHRGFMDDLIVCLLEAVFAKVEGNNNIKLAPKAVFQPYILRHLRGLMSS